VRIFYQPFNIPSGSMKETLLVGDYLFVSKLPAATAGTRFPSAAPCCRRMLSTDGSASQPKRGDVVVFKYP
jgi:signal peptidase I